MLALLSKVSRVTTETGTAEEKIWRIVSALK